MAALIILGLLDLITGIMLVLGFVMPLGENPLLFSLGVLVMIKGIISWIMAASQKLLFDPMSILDVLVGIFAIIEVSGFHLSIFSWFGIFILLKGLYSIAVDAMRR